jgi:CheY-like chemotaxis protein
VERIRERRGPLPAVFVSGYTSETVRARDRLPDGSAFVQKPFTTDDLLTTLRSVLDAAQTGPETPQITDR